MVSQSENLIPVPKKLDEMIGVAEKRAKGPELARIDFLMNGTDVFVNEISLFPDGGFGRFNVPALKKIIRKINWLTFQSNEGFADKIRYASYSGTLLYQTRFIEANS